MWASLAADLVLVLHMGFVALVVLGGAMWLWWRFSPLAHLPAAAWGAYVELANRPCPLTALENALLARAGEEGYANSFIAHYLLAVLYPEGLDREAQWLLGAGVVGLNVVIYVLVARRRRVRRRSQRRGQTLTDG